MQPGDEQFHLLVDAVKDYAIFMLDPQGVVSTWNPGAERIKGYAPAEIVGRHFSLFYTPEDRQEGAPARGLAAARRDGRYSAQGVRVRKDGSRFVADVLITPVLKDGVLVGFAKVTRDVTERHQLEQQLRTRVDMLAESDRRKDEYIAMLAHELRNPLAPVMTGLAIVGRASQHPPIAQRAIQTMDRQLRLMTRLIDDLLQISRMSRGLISLRREHADFATLVAQALEMVEPLAQERRQQVAVQIPAGVQIYCDAQRVVQALGNVLHNASKFTEAGGSIDVSARVDDTQVEVSVRDSGIGVRPEMRERIFEVFSQDQRSAGAEMQSGLGVGLALTRNIVAMHGGRIWVESAGPGKGSTFHIVLPLLSVADHETGAHPVRKEFRVLVVDDNRDAADMVGDLLELQGFVVQRAYSGTEGLRMAEEMHPHLILLDLLMPDITGYEVIRRVRRNPGGPVVVALTGHGSAQDRDEVRNAGFDEHIVKPVAGDAVLEVVQRFLDRAPTAA
jgi:PAS domain S-box-containing protein